MGQSDKELLYLVLPNEAEIFEACLDKAVSETRLLADQVESCQKCGFRINGKKPITGAGYPLADLFLLKECASQGEQKEGIAFAGPMIDVLRKAFEKLDFSISSVYGTNVIKCQKESVRIERRDIEVCSNYLRTEIEICQPRVIVAMGLASCHALGVFEQGLEQIDYKPGSIFKLRPDLHVVVTCNLEMAMDDDNSKHRFWKDLQTAKALLDKEIIREREK